MRLSTVSPSSAMKKTARQIFFGPVSTHPARRNSSIRNPHSANSENRMAEAEISAFSGFIKKGKYESTKRRQTVADQSTGAIYGSGPIADGSSGCRKRLAVHCR
jgi:hypothetical protein